MSGLRVFADVPMGPLSIEILCDGEAIAQLALSSTRLSADVHDLADGAYAVVVKRSNGERLYFSVMLPDDTALNVAQHEPARVSPWANRGAEASDTDNPGAFMESEIYRGDLMGMGVPGDARPTLTGLTTSLEYPLAGAPGRALDSILGSRKLATTSLPADVAARRNPFARRNERAFAEISGRRDLRLSLWVAPGAVRAAAPNPVVNVEHSPDFLKVTLHTKHTLLIALLDADGFGPVVSAPPFHDGLDITFLARGIASRGADRSANPTGQRTPVALAAPRHAGAADLLSAIASPQVENQSALWSDASKSLTPFDPGESAIELLLTKFERPAEAMLGAHYLLRFLPHRLPLQWADNLTAAMPDVADGYVIAGWLRLLSSAKDVTTLAPDAISAQFGKLMSTALEKSTFLFARTRSLLADGLRIDAGAVHDRDRETQLRRALNYGAAAGGLECYWGAGAEGAGDRQPALPDGAPVTVANLSVRNGAFLPPALALTGLSQLAPL